MTADYPVPNPDSLFRVGDRTVELKVHRCLWSGRYSENSPLAIAECATERVLRTEIDVRALRDGEFVVLHDDRFDRVTDARGLVREATAVEATRPRFKDGSHPLLFKEATLLIAANEYPGASSSISRILPHTPTHRPRRSSERCSRSKSGVTSLARRIGTSGASSRSTRRFR